jgi:hypothetical protein
VQVEPLPKIEDPNFILMIKEKNAKKNTILNPSDSLPSTESCCPKFTFKHYNENKKN